MGIFEWLFGGKREAKIDWVRSERGNLTATIGNRRVTVFASDGGWKYVFADNTRDDDDAYFSDPYATESMAQEEAEAHMAGTPSHHRSLSDDRDDRRRGKWERVIEEREQALAELEAALQAPELNVTALRKPESKIASHLKQLGWQMAEYQTAGVSRQKIELAKRQEARLSALGKEVAERLASKAKGKKPPNPTMAASTLPDELARKVDDLIALFESAPVLSDEDRSRLSRQASRKASAKMIEEGTTFGEASGGPAFLNQDEESFRAFLKSVDQDLGWQCNTVAETFKKHQQDGMIPPPYYPTRVIVLLRKANDLERERRFLAAWCRHFPKGNGVKYQKLVERAKEVGATS